MYSFEHFCRIWDSKSDRRALFWIFQISPTNDPSQNWTLSTPPTLSSTEEDTYDSLFSSLKTSHSSSLKELCTCSSQPNLSRVIHPESKPHTELQRVASWPRAASDPHRFDLVLGAQGDMQELKQLPTVPPSDFWTLVPEQPVIQDWRIGNAQLLSI